jgi:hypothetical protein
MPFLEDENMQIALPKAIGIDDVEVENDVDFKDKLNAAFRIENTVGSLLAKNGNLPDNRVTNPDFSPLDYVTEEEKLNDRFLSEAVMADNESEIESLRGQFARESEDRATLEDGGFLAIAMAAIADPINLIPVGGVAYKTYKTGSSILSGGLVTAGAAAASTAATEAGLHYSQVKRTYGESAVNVTGAALLGGILGAAPGAVRNYISRSGNNVDDALLDIERTMSPEEVINNGDNPNLSGELRSVGAAGVMDDVNVRGKMARVMTKALGFDPLSQTITSDVKATRKTSARLAENPIDMDRDISTSVESNIKAHDGKLFEAIDSNAKLYKEYAVNGGKMSSREFNQEVGKAVRNGSSDPIIQRAADSWDKLVYEPLKKEAIAAKILPEDVDVTTAKNYLNRVWNREKLASNVNGFISTTTKWLMKRNPELDQLEASDLADQIATRILASPDGRLPYDYQIGENAPTGGKSSGLKGQFKKRSFDIDDALVEEFLENDIEVLGARYVNNVAPDIELVREFGDVNMTNELKDVQREWLERIKKEKDPKKARKLRKQAAKDQKNLEAMRDRLRNIYKIPDSDNLAVRAGRVARDLNYMRLLGGVVAASIPDVGRVVMAEGIVNTFVMGLKPLIKNMSSFKLSAREAKLAGVGTDALMGGRAEIIADTADYAIGGTAFERGVRSAATKFSSINLMNQWTGAMKQMHAVTMQTRVVNDLLAGTYDKRLGQLGINKADALNITQQFKKYAENIDGVWVTNTKDWDAPELVRMWRAAVRKESDRVIVVPGQEKPLFMSTELGKTIFQFKSFMLSATQRILISSLQKQDKHMFQGLMSLVSLGMMSYAFKQWDAGREITDDPMTLVIEGIDRSGALGILMEMNNTVEKITGNAVGARPLLGVSSPASRYASRSALDSALGPTFGLAGDVIKGLNAISDTGEWTQADTRTIKRLVPGNNLSILRQGFEKLENEINDSMGIDK